MEEGVSLSLGVSEKKTDSSNLGSPGCVVLGCLDSEFWTPPWGCSHLLNVKRHRWRWRLSFVYQPVPGRGIDRALSSVLYFCSSSDLGKGYKSRLPRVDWSNKDGCASAMGKSGRPGL